MGAPAVGAVVLVRSPFSDLSHAKLRPAVCLADADRGDFVLCQSTSNAYGDRLAVAVDNRDFSSGSLRVASFARPGKLFTANVALIARTIGALKAQSHLRIVDAVVALLRASRQP
jgi:mRNA interferase MazF